MYPYTADPCKQTLIGVRMLFSLRLPVLMASSCIFGFGLGVKRATLLCNALDIFSNITAKDIEIVDGFSVKTSERIINSLPAFKKFVKGLEHCLTIVKPQEKQSDKLSGNKYVFSGFRDKDLENKILKNGGVVAGTVSSKTTALIVSSMEEKSSKVSKALSLKVEIVERVEFIKLLG